MTKYNPPNQSLNNRINQILDDLMDYWRSDRWQHPMKKDDKTFAEQIHHLIQDEVIRELESLRKPIVTTTDEVLELDNRLMQRIKDLPRPDERYAKWEIRAELDDIHQLIQDEVVKELEAVYSNLVRLNIAGPAKWDVDDRISALREGKE